MKYVALSDFHGYLIPMEELPEGDVLLICGDILPLSVQRDTVAATVWFVTQFLPWTQTLSYKYIVFIAGNHDFLLEKLDIKNYTLYGENISKVDYINGNKKGKLVLVTSINPTPYGEGKTTMSIGINDAFRKLNKNSIVVLREPSMGPVFGIKGGAAGGGYSQVVPMEDINLHFTGDIHAMTTANNLLCAAIDNHIHQGNMLNIDSRRIVFKRVMDMNDRSLRNIVVGLGGKINGVPREDGFMITVASEIMAILCLATDLTDLKNRFAKIIEFFAGLRIDNKPVIL